MSKLNNQRATRAFTLLEIIISIAVFTFILSTVVLTSTQVLVIWKANRDKAEAARQASLVTEWLVRDIQNSYYLLEAASTSLKLHTADYNDVRYYLQDNTLWRNSACQSTYYPVCENISAFTLRYYNALNVEIINPQVSDFPAIVAIEVDITAQKAGANQSFRLNTVGRLASEVCGKSMVVTHTAGTVAPVTKTVVYGIVSTALTGSTKCWITQNLGATNQATSATDATEPSAGWYWQFNRTQGYKYDGATRTPSTAWSTIEDNTYTGWDPAKDPCTLLLGTGWRLPTNDEWTNADANGQVGGWDNYTETYNDVLKLHAAGYLVNPNGELNNRGSYGSYWSSTQYASTVGWELDFVSNSSGMYSNGKAYGFSVRCLRD